MPARHQEVRARYAIAYRSAMDLSGQLSNPQLPLRLWLTWTSRRRKAPHPRRPKEPPRVERRTSRSLKPAQVDALVAAYEAGNSMKKLAAAFGVHRNTVKAHLRRADVQIRRGGLDA